MAVEELQLLVHSQPHAAVRQICHRHLDTADVAAMAGNDQLVLTELTAMRNLLDMALTPWAD